MAKRAVTKKRATRARSTTVTRMQAAAPARTALGVGADSGGTLLTEGFVTISIGDKHFELRGVIGHYLKVEYQVSFEDAEPLGTIPEIIGDVAQALGIPKVEEFMDGPLGLNTMLKELKEVPLVGPVAEILATGLIKVTDLGIDTQAGTYRFGFGVDLVGKKEADTGGIKLDAFGLLFTYTSPKGAT